LQLDAVVIGVGDAKVGGDVIRGHCWASPVVRAYGVRSGERCQSAAHAGRARQACRIGRRARWQSAFHVLEQWTGIEKRLQRGRRKIMRER
jgi:hypothetical protein